MKLNLTWKSLQQSQDVKYIGKETGRLSWTLHIDDVTNKLKKGNATSLKFRDFLAATYYVLIGSSIHFACLSWVKRSM